MEPTLHDQQFVTVNRIYSIRPPSRGDIITFLYPVDTSRVFIKRVIGLPAEKIQIIKGQVYVNDLPLQESPAIQRANYDWGPQIASGEEYFVLGDNRGNSSDSHTWGMLPKKNILGQAWFSYWPAAYWGLVR